MEVHVYEDYDSMWYLFFFSSRRRHTILQGDWSSDVCSSDLKFAVEVDRACNAMPRLDAQERRPAGLGPDAQLVESLPRHFDRRPLFGGITHAGAGRPIQNDGVVIEQPLGERERLALDGRGLRRWEHEPVFQTADRRRLIIGKG